jgi:hypothetical protein
MTVYKTVLAPNAPWPQRNVVLKVKKVRSKPSDTDARFKQWMEKINGS